MLHEVITHAGVCKLLRQIEDAAQPLRKTHHFYVQIEALQVKFFLE